MALNYDRIMNRGFAPVRAAYGRRDTILYALGVGAGQEDPSDAQDLVLTYERQLEALPTMAVVLCQPGFWVTEPELGITWQALLHGEQRLNLRRPLPVEGEIVGQERVEAIYDKSAGKGAIMRISRTLVDTASGELIGVVESSAFLRADGGFGGDSAGAPPPHRLPERVPDLSIALSTRPEQALIYRLSGDYNPLHIDPQVAAAAGFERPILHGLCTYGVAGRALIRAIGGGKPSRLRRLDARFTAPVFPGETIMTDIWREDGGQAAFRCRVQQRDVVVLNNGLAEFVD